MNEKYCLLFILILHVTVVLESRVIVPRDEDTSSGNEEIPFSINPLETGKKLDPSIEDSYYDYYEGIPIDVRPPKDYNEHDMDDELPGIKPERFPAGTGRGERPQIIPKENDDIDKSADKNFNRPLDKEASDKFENNNNKGSGKPLDEDKSIHKDRDESEVEYTGPEDSEEDQNDKRHKPEDEEKPAEEEKGEDEVEEMPEEEKKDEELDPEKPDEEKKEEELDEEKPDEEKKEEELDEEKPDIEKKEEELDEEKPDEGKIEEGDEEKLYEEEIAEKEKHEPEGDDGMKTIPEEGPIEDDDEEEETAKKDEDDNEESEDGVPQKGDAGFLPGSSVFDTPFFNLEKVKKYFSQLDRAFGHVFRQTMDEALLLNGTYANTTEEEVDIDGKKYIITKSIIKGADNYSSMYIESLSAKPKINSSEEMKDFEIKNLTHT